ncbi:glycerol-3-phosphate dehydrogenase [Micromonospora coxensis]|uniref:Glycerol-3-phosphate dehydrogenase n=1 Tax=Micromonospora coxensis TaxID=356852 RepID=A0A1C5K1V4_9ACTN|nr:glycerol-3-phosphate dehydrogenase/oxidase [Micromonospora coxensis]SCG76804.1 glycerol-3-phosphate dehydrogenase [Micromonospora coxensis]
MIHPTRLGPSERAENWRRLGSEQFDILVVGGGVTGTGVALDAATRGLRVALVEARDFAAGTSSRSSKLFHGGLRYLEQLNFGLVKEALRERELMLTRIAPHLVRPVSFLYPLRHRVWERPYVTAGLTLYDTLAGKRSVPRHQQLSRTAARRLCPSLRPDALVGAVRYFDAQVDDARHTMTVARTAATYGATVLNSAEVVEFRRTGDRIVGARVRDVETGAHTDVAATVVINCAGVWTDELHRLAGRRGQYHVHASKGVHLVVPRDRIHSTTGLILRTERSVLFVIPWGAHWIVGTTDTTWELGKAHPTATEADITYLLEQVNEVLATPLTRDDIEGVYAGLRPLLAGGTDDTTKLSREHVISRTQPGMLSVAGGKYTTYRVMAADAVDAAAVDLDRPLPRTVTDRIALLGAEGYPALRNQIPVLAQRYGLPSWTVRHLLGRYGSLIGEVLAAAEEDPSLLLPLPGAERYLRAEFRYAATHESALHLDDLLARRSRISIEESHRGTETAEAVAGIVADVLGWDERRRRAEVEAYTARVEAERRSHTQADDPTAEAVRVAAPDSRLTTVVA